MDTKKIVIPKFMLKEADGHPDEYGEFVVTLANGMYTDIYIDETNDEIYTYTNDEALIKYIEDTKRRMKKMKNYVKISSTRNIQVTGGLEHLNMTNPTEAVANKLKVQPLWSKEKVLIKQGVSWYPGNIVEWATVKALAHDNIITIGEFADELPNEISTTESSEIVKREEKLKQGKEETLRQKAAHTKLKNIVLKDK